VTFTLFTGQTVKMTTATTGAKIFYTDNNSTPTHNGAIPTGTTHLYTGPVTVGRCNEVFFKALAYKSGMTDSIVTSFDADYSGLPNCGGGNFAMMQSEMETTQSSTTTTTIIYSVWDGDWAILEEYDSNDALVQKYLQGYHGLVKTFVGTAVYYYQDELGSTSHIAGGTGALIESYQYELYGKPRVYNSGGIYQPNATPLAKDLGNGGARWVPEIGLYDNRNRFMSPDLGRFLQPDPIGFKGDASNLYRYCGNDWANKTDPLGLATEFELQYRPVEGARSYSHEYIVARDTNTGQTIVSRAGPGEEYTLGFRGAFFNLAQKSSTGQGNVKLFAEMGPKEKYKGTDVTKESKTVPGSKVTLKDDFGTVKTKLEKFNNAVNKAEIDYRPKTTNSNGYAVTGYKDITGKSAPELKSAPGSHLNLKAKTPQSASPPPTPPPPPPQASNAEPADIGGEGFVALGGVIFGARNEGLHTGGPP
jgi:RHS repeat-associated protein